MSSNDVETAVRAAETLRCAAMLANDGAGLEALLDPGLKFIHATGAVDDKTAYLNKIASGRISYIGIAWSEESVAPIADAVAIMTGRMITDVSVESVPKRLNNRVTTVWRQTEGAWRLVAFQSTPLA